MTKQKTELDPFEHGTQLTSVSHHKLTLSKNAYVVVRFVFTMYFLFKKYKNNFLSVKLGCKFEIPTDYHISNPVNAVKTSNF